MGLTLGSIEVDQGGLNSFWRVGLQIGAYIGGLSGNVI